MAENSPAQAGWVCPHQGCGKAFTELWRLRSHYRQPARGTSATRGHGVELLQCPRCTEPLSLQKNARHRCKLAPARVAAAAAAAAAAGHAAGAAEGQEEGGGEAPPKARKRRRVRWQGFSDDEGVSGVGNSSSEEEEELENQEEEEDGRAAVRRQPAQGSPAAAQQAAAAGMAAADEEVDGPSRTVPPPLPLPHPTPRGAAAAEVLLRISSGSGSLPSPLPAPPLIAAARDAPLQAAAASPPAGGDSAACQAGGGAGWWQVQNSRSSGSAGLPQAPFAAPPPLRLHVPVAPALQFSSQAAPAAQPLRLISQPVPPVPADLILPTAAQHLPALQAPQHPPAVRAAPYQPQQDEHLQQLPLPPQALAAAATDLILQLLALLKQVTSDTDAEEFVSLVVKHTAERLGPAAGAAAAAAGGSAGAGRSADALLAGLVAELSVRCNAVQSLLQQQRHRELAEGVLSALRAARLAAAVTQLSALLSGQGQ